MKNERGAFRMLRREQLLQEVVHDSYKSDHKLAEPARCPDCGAVYRHGRWRWGTAPAGTHEARCPACHRIRDRFPAGYLSLNGKSIDEHRDEILRRAHRTLIRSAGSCSCSGRSARSSISSPSACCCGRSRPGRNSSGRAGSSNRWRARCS